MDSPKSPTVKTNSVNLAVIKINDYEVARRESEAARCRTKPPVEKDNNALRRSYDDNVARGKNDKNAVRRKKRMT